MNRLLVICLLFLFSAQTLAAGLVHDCGQMHGDSSMVATTGDMPMTDGQHGHHGHEPADLAADMTTHMPGHGTDMPCCDPQAAESASSAAEAAWQCQLSCEAGACATPVVLLSSYSPIDFTLEQHPATAAAADRPLTTPASLFRPPIAV